PGAGVGPRGDQHAGHVVGKRPGVRPVGVAERRDILSLPNVPDDPLAHRALRARADEVGGADGSPVPGYVAPADTVRPASRVTTLLLRIVVEAAAAGRLPDADIRDAEAQPVAAALAPIRSYLPPGVPAPLVPRALMVWTNLFGVVSFEVFGQLHSVVGDPPADRDAFFAECVRH
ncbi:MAG TPA: TetR-like C-terminal domain-containing protein, partial [Nakamurella sp.]